MEKPWQQMGQGSMLGSLEDDITQDCQYEAIRTFMEVLFLPAAGERLKEFPGADAKLRQVYEELHGCSHRHDDDQQQDIFDLELYHECMSMACHKADSCELCTNNPMRCHPTMFLQEKYREGTALESRCGQPLMIALRHRRKGVISKMSGEVVVNLLHGRSYESCFAGKKPQCSEDFDQCIVRWSKKAKPGEPVLVCEPSAHAISSNGEIRIPMKDGIAVLPSSTKTMYSCIAEDSNCRSATYRLLVRIIPQSGNFPPPECVSAGVSQDFLTVTTRGFLIQKPKRPFFSDDVQKLQRVGDACTKRLNALHNVFPNEGFEDKICTVGDFVKLSRKIDGNGVLKSKFLHAVGMNETDWTEACRHAEKAIKNDARVRYWSAIDGNECFPMLIYKCSEAQIDLASGPIALYDGATITWKHLWDSQQHCIVKNLREVAYQCWWKECHPGWGVAPATLEEFERDPYVVKRHVLGLRSQPDAHPRLPDIWSPTYLNQNMREAPLLSSTVPAPGFHAPWPNNDYGWADMCMVPPSPLPVPAPVVIPDAPDSPFTSPKEETSSAVDTTQVAEPDKLASLMWSEWPVPHEVQDLPSCGAAVQDPHQQLQYPDATFWPPCNYPAAPLDHACGLGDSFTMSLNLTEMSASFTKSLEFEPVAG